MKKTAFITLMLFMLVTPRLVWGAPADPTLTAKSAIVIEASTGRIIFAQGASDRRPPASTTKMMTLIVALEHGNLNDIVTTSPGAAATEGSSMWLAPGEQLKLGDMLYGMMLVSGNDATVAVAEHISGSMDKFARLMTEKARAIGALNTNFTNSSGLPGPQHYSTASDLARIAAYGYKNPLFAQIVGTRHAVVPWPGKDHDRDLYNENKLLWQYEGGNGIKTGFTKAAGRCLAFSAERGGHTIVGVVLNCPDMWNDAKAMLDYGFTDYTWKTFVKAGDTVATLKVSRGMKNSLEIRAKEDILIPMRQDEPENAVTLKVVSKETVEAPVYEDQVVGMLEAWGDGKRLHAVPLVASETVLRKEFPYFLWEIARGWTA